MSKRHLATFAGLQVLWTGMFMRDHGNVINYTQWHSFDLYCLQLTTAWSACMQCSPGIWQNKEWYDEVRLSMHDYTYSLVNLWGSKVVHGQLPNAFTGSLTVGPQISEQDGSCCLGWWRELAWVRIVLQQQWCSIVIMTWVEHNIICLFIILTLKLQLN